ncbi:MAG: SDR family NAD(P)-dependent oxidoreductase, partial [Gemmatimonadaceae bacterium]
LDVNIVALTYLSKRVLPWLRSNGRGHVMNLASVAAFQPGPLMAVYYASKAYVLSLSEALHNEYGGSGVTVTAVCPGPTETGFQRASGVPSGRRPGGPQLLSAREVALQAYRAARGGRRVVVPGMANRIAAFLGRHMPSGYTAQFVRRIQESRLP